MAKAKKRRNINTKANARVSTLKETIRNEVIGVFVVGMACLGMVALYSDRSGVVGGQIKHLLTVLAGGGRVCIPLMVGCMGSCFYEQANTPSRIKGCGGNPSLACFARDTPPSITGHRGIFPGRHVS